MTAAAKAHEPNGALRLYSAPWAGRPHNDAHGKASGNAVLAKAAPCTAAACGPTITAA